MSISRSSGGIALAAVVVLGLFATMSRPDEYAPVFQNLREEDAAAIVAKLKESKVAYEIGDRGATIAVRVPDHDFTRELLRATGPLAVSSANVSGQASLVWMTNGRSSSWASSIWATNTASC